MPLKLVPLNVDTGSHRQDGKSQFADEVEDVAMNLQQNHKDDQKASKSH